jgi:hypothetical protein
MRRGFSIVLMLILGLVPLSAFIDGSEDTNLPACCRRHGAHHCSAVVHMAAVRVKIEAGSTPVLAAPLTCPDYPGAATAFSTPLSALTVSVQSATILTVQARVAPRTPETPSSRHDAAQSERGPPSSYIPG